MLRKRDSLLILSVIMLWPHQTSHAEAPLVSYIFPAGGQRGTSIEARLGGCNLFESPKLFWSGDDIAAPATLQRTETVWFEGPLIPQPASQQREDYPQDYAASLSIAANAAPGSHAWRVATSQGVTAAWGFIVGDFPEIVEREEEGNTPAISITLPVTINGRTFPREDVDAYQFSASAGQIITCHTAASVFGSPLRACVSVLDAQGRVLAEAVPEGEATPPLYFVVPVTGDYVVRIHDVGYQGLQNYVYRLTVTAGPVIDSIYPLGGRRGQFTRFELKGANLPAQETMVTLPAAGNATPFPVATNTFTTARVELDDLDEFLEASQTANDVQAFTIPGNVNGRIRTPGEEDVWQFTAEKGLDYEFDVQSAKLGSYLDPVIRVCDATGKTMKEDDNRLHWNAAESGSYQLRIRDRFATRGDDRFGYRVRGTSSVTPEFTVSLAVDSINVEPGQTVKVKLTVHRGPGFKEPIEITCDRLPAGLTLESPCQIAADKNETQLIFKADKDAQASTIPVRVTAKAKVGEREIQRTAFTTATSSGPDGVAVADSSGALWVSVALPTPFKFVGIFESKYVARGAVYVRKYHIERNGFTGALQVQLADRQGRHLQGVTAQTVRIEPNQNDFEFAVALPSWMEVGRTCRSTLSMTGVTTDSEGRPQTICYSSNDQHNQMIALVATGRLSVQLRQTTFKIRPDSTLELPIQIQRGPGITGPVTLELVQAKSLTQITSKATVVNSDQPTGQLILQIGHDITGLDQHPLTVRATSQDERQLPVTAETKLNLVE